MSERSERIDRHGGRNATYAISVDGHLDPHWAAWLGDLEVSPNRDGTSTIVLRVADQARLHAVLAGLRDIGAVITELRRG